MKKKILFVLTSHDTKGSSGQPTGFYLSEAAHPWEVLSEAGYEIDFVSPKGGMPPVDGFDLTDPVNKKFWENTFYHEKLKRTMRPADVNAQDYSLIHYVGGHGAMWDFPDNGELARLAQQIYENGGIVSAVCHGPAGLVNIKLSDGKYLVDGKRLTAFTNKEEVEVELDQVVPFLLETKLAERGGKFEAGANRDVNVVLDGRLITGQNPQSAKALGQGVLEELKKIEQQ